MGSRLLSPGSWCVQNFVYALPDWSLLFPQSSISPVIKSYWPSTPDSWGFQSLCRIPRLGSLMLDSELLQQYENFFGIVVIQSVCHTSVRYEILFYHHCAPLAICCGFFFVFGHWVSFFGGFQCPPVDHCSTASYCFGAITRGDEYMSFYSTILNQKPLEF